MKVRLPALALPLMLIVAPSIVRAADWISLPKMQRARNDHGALLLQDGRVLVTGGAQKDVPSDAELYDPRTNTWKLTSKPSLVHEKFSLLLDDGRVFVPSQTAAELYDPAKDSWTRTAPMKTTRAAAYYAKLIDGRVVAIGGYVPGDVGNDRDSAEIWDPKTDTWTTAAGEARVPTPVLRRLRRTARRRARARRRGHRRATE